MFWLIHFGVDVNAQNKKGETPMHLLLKNPRDLDTKLLRELIFKGAEKQVRDSNGFTALEVYRLEEE